MLNGVFFFILTENKHFKCRYIPLTYFRSLFNSDSLTQAYDIVRIVQCFSIVSCDNGNGFVPFIFLNLFSNPPKIIDYVMSRVWTKKRELSYVMLVG